MDSCYDLSIVYIHCMHYIILYMSVSNVYTSEGIDCKYPCEMDVRVKGTSGPVFFYEVFNTLRFKGSGHYRLLLKIIVSIKPYDEE